MNKASILLVYTGGTIGMKADPVDGTLRPFDFGEILREVPELSKFAVRLDTYTFDPLIDSSDVEPSLWQAIAELIRERYDHYDGFVILHGTDTMAYTASALSFMLENLSKPVILTGSQLPIGTLRTDGKENLISAVEIAAAKDGEGDALVPEVAIYFNAKLEHKPWRFVISRCADKNDRWTCQYSDRDTLKTWQKTGISGSCGLSKTPCACGFSAIR